MYLFLINFIYLFEFWLCWVFIAACGFSLVAMRGGYFLVAMDGLHAVAASLVAEHRLSRTWASVVVARGCSNQPADSRIWAQQLWCMDLIAWWHMKSSWTRNLTHVPCIGWQILSHWIIREVQFTLFLIDLKYTHLFKILRVIMYWVIMYG